ncbi:MAG: TIGR00297 family protein [Candidatus Methanomethylophilaceae archaeon]
MDLLLQAALAVMLSLALSLAALKVGMLTPDGTAAAAAVLLVIGLMGGLDWLMMLVIFAAIGFAATRFAFKEKKRDGLQEGKHGERTWKNIVGVALAPALVAIVDFATTGHDSIFIVAYIGSVAVAASDTVASEIGVRDKRVWLVTTLKRVEAGTNGGVSILGLSVSLVAAAVVSLIGWTVLFRDLSWLIVLPMVAGMAGNLLDSFFGATIEDRVISKYTNNFITGISGAILAAAAYMLF